MRSGIWTVGAVAGMALFLGSILPAAAVDSDPTPGSSFSISETPTVQFEAKPGRYVRPPQVVAQSWIVADAETGEIFASKDPDRRLPPASTLKMLTAVSLIDRLEGDSTFAPTLQDINQPGTKIGLRAGTPFVVSDLFAGMIMNSGNDAASALANAYGGWDNTLAIMNSEAARLGATNTHAVTPNGLDKNDQVSTSTDLATIFRAAIDIPEIRKILATKEQWMESPTTGRKMKLYNRNAMLQWDYPGHIGAKTGYTSRAGNTLVAASERGGRTLVMAAMRTGMKMNTIAPRLFDWVASNDKDLVAIGTLPQSQPRTDLQAIPAIAMEQEGGPVPGQEELLQVAGVLGTDSTSDSGQAAATASTYVVMAALGGTALIVLAVIYRRRRTGIDST
ncbi:MAG: D-alanyl-D-alanine carboxypeptidase [Actinobacteria bacterium]|nr:D-alanyl-D-alanine carboxypeptidase [Actinomycetota bacterium]